MALECLLRNKSVFLIPMSLYRHLLVVINDQMLIQIAEFFRILNLSSFITLSTCEI